jgi:hypothetical protein
MSATTNAAESFTLGPKAITGVVREDKKTLIVDWGGIGPAVERSPAECDRDRQQLRDYLASPEFQKWFAEIAADAHKKEERQARELVTKKKDEYENEPQVPDRPVAGVLREANYELAPWQKRIPQELRGSVSFLAIDFSDPKQIAYAMRMVERDPAMKIYAVGWNSQAEVDGMVKSIPNLAKTQKLRRSQEGGSRSVERWLDSWNITALPGRVRIVDDRVVVQEGFAP